MIFSTMIYAYILSIGSSHCLRKFSMTGGNRFKSGAKIGQKE
jgi:hypothetical protein